MEGNKSQPQTPSGGARPDFLNKPAPQPPRPSGTFKVQQGGNLIPPSTPAPLLEKEEKCKTQLERMIDKCLKFMTERLTPASDGHPKEDSNKEIIENIVGDNKIWMSEQLKEDSRWYKENYFVDDKSILAIKGNKIKDFGIDKGSEIWYKIGYCLAEWLPSDERENYEKAVQTVRNDFESILKDNNIEDQLKAIETQRALARKMLVYIQQKQYEMKGAMAAKGRHKKVKRKPNLLEFKKVADGTGAMDVSSADVIKRIDSGVKNDFKKMAETFLSEGIKKIQNKPKECTRLDDGYKTAMQSALSDKSLKEWRIKDASLSDEERNKRVAMAVLLISTAYVGEYDKIISACEGLKVGGVKGSEQNIAGWGATIRKAIKKGAQSGFKGDDLVKYVKDEANKGLSYLININKLKDIMNKFHKKWSFKRFFSRKKKSKNAQSS